MAWLRKPAARWPDAGAAGERRARPDEPAAPARADDRRHRAADRDGQPPYEAGQIGVEEAWSNPESGNSGTAEILETFERDGLPCRRVEHVIKIARDAVPKRVVLATCRVADGRWLLV